MRAVWDEWVRADKAGLVKLIAKYKAGKQSTGPKVAPKPALSNTASAN